MDQLVLVRTVHVFSQSIVIGIVIRSSGRLNPEFSKFLVVDHADILRTVIRMVNKTCRLLSALGAPG